MRNQVENRTWKNTSGEIVSDRQEEMVKWKELESLIKIFRVLHQDRSRQRHFGRISRSLDGIWEFCHRNREEICKRDGPAEGNNWNCIEVPSFISATADRAEGFTGVYSYRRTISLLWEWRSIR